MIILKSAQKFLEKTDKATRKKLEKALNKIQNNQVNIEPLKQIKKGMESGLYRYKMEHYRIIFKKEADITIKFIGTKNDTKFRRTGCM